jgi:hypothetical protein
MLAVLRSGRMACNLIAIFQALSQHVQDKHKTPWATLTTAWAHALVTARDEQLRGLATSPVQPTSPNEPQATPPSTPRSPENTPRDCASTIPGEPCRRTDGDHLRHRPRSTGGPDRSDLPRRD